MLTVGVLRETAPGETRVALVPDDVARVRALGADVLVEPGAGTGSGHDDASYAGAGADVCSRARVWSTSDVVLCVGPPAWPRGPRRRSRVLLGLIDTASHPDWVAAAARTGSTVLSLDGVPRTLSRAQPLDALTSQANVAGYKAALLAASTYPGFFPMLMTAAGTVRPAEVLVLGAGVAGLQAMATARRLGALVTGWDVRAAAREDLAATGAAVLDLAAEEGSGDGGYARELTGDEGSRLRTQLALAVPRFDVVIATARVPGRPAPLLVGEDALAQMRRGSVVVDLAAGRKGGNVAGSVDGLVSVTPGGVTVVGAASLERTVPRAASAALSRNLAAALKHLVPDGTLHLDPQDEITAGLLVCCGGALVRPGLDTTHRRRAS